MKMTVRESGLRESDGGRDLAASASLLARRAGV